MYCKVELLNAWASDFNRITQNYFDQEQIKTRECSKCAQLTSVDSVSSAVTSMIPGDVTEESRDAADVMTAREIEAPELHAFKHLASESIVSAKNEVNGDDTPLLEADDKKSAVEVLADGADVMMADDCKTADEIIADDSGKPKSETVLLVAAEPSSSRCTCARDTHVTDDVTAHRKPCVTDPFNMNGELLSAVVYLTSLCLELKSFGDVSKMAPYFPPRLTQYEQPVTRDSREEECRVEVTLQMTLFMQCHFYALDVAATHDVIMEEADERPRLLLWWAFVNCSQGTATCHDMCKKLVVII